MSEKGAGSQPDAILLNDLFKLFIVLDTLLLAGYLILYDTFFVPTPVFKIIPAFLALVSWSAAVAGVFPDMGGGSDASQARFKLVCLAVTVGALWLGFMIFAAVRLLAGMGIVV